MYFLDPPRGLGMAASENRRAVYGIGYLILRIEILRKQEGAIGKVLMPSHEQHSFWCLKPQDLGMWTLQGY